MHKENSESITATTGLIGCWVLSGLFNSISAMFYDGSSHVAKLRSFNFTLNLVSDFVYRVSAKSAEKTSGGFVTRSSLFEASCRDQEWGTTRQFVIDIRVVLSLLL